MLTLNSILKSLKRLVNEEFECPICLELCTDTHLSPDCGHRFCGKCIRESIRKCNHECPTCRFPIATHRSCRQDPQFDRMLQRLVTELIEPLDKQMIGQNGTEEVKDLKKDDRRLAPPSHQSAEDFEVPESTPKKKRKVKSYCQTTRKRKRRDEDGNVPLECEMLQLATNTRRRSKRFKQVKATITMEAEQNDLSHLPDEDKHLPFDKDKTQNAQQHSQKSSSSFNRRFKELARFKREYGHCRVPQKKLKDPKYYSLGKWVNTIRCSYRVIQRGEKPKRNLSEAEIKRLDDIGFEWESSRNAQRFESHCTDLLKYREEYGHCLVRQKKSKDAKHYSLGLWVSDMRRSYRAMQRGEKPKHNLSEAEIKRLDDIGFEWESSRSAQTFDKHYTDLLKFKEEFGHCRVAKKSKGVKHFSLGLWVSNMRRSYRAIQRGEKPNRTLSEADIKRLDDIGFEWGSSR